MSDYTTDWVHIQSGYRHLVPAAACLVLLLMSVGFALIRGRFAPRVPVSFVTLFIIFAFLGTVGLAVMGVVVNFWAVHAHDFVAGTPSQESLRASVMETCGNEMEISPDLKVEAGVVMGWQDYKTWFCLRGRWQALRDEAVQAGWEPAEVRKTPDELQHFYSPIPEPIDRWLRQTAFEPDLAFAKQTADGSRWIEIDSKRDLILLTVQEY